LRRPLVHKVAAWPLNSPRLGSERVDPWRLARMGTATQTTRLCI
jgi:hypothetical protein